ncbi:helicase-related protein [Pseudonocardia sp. Cha107L01]|uniref:helicase-related protein n=1 Tax=Pseudonocardia sp. Cha107L01 TaxID=3457576 RepID=UPI00403E7F33
MTTPNIHQTSGREAVLNALRQELVGPRPAGHHLEIKDETVHFLNPEDSYGPWVDSVTGEEILQRDPPTRRYGVAVLYPPRQRPEPGDDLAASGGQGTDDQQGAARSTPDDTSRHRSIPGAADSGDFDVSLANSFKPSAMGLSFLVTLGRDDAQILLDVSGATYSQIHVHSDGKPREWWLRKPAATTASIRADEILNVESKVVPCDLSEHWPALNLSLELYCRPWGARQSLITATLVNRTSNARPLDGRCLFQVHMRLRTSGAACFEPYPDREEHTKDPEVASFNLLYRDEATYAVGHGCAADWQRDEGNLVLSAEAMPTFETPSITPEITLEDGTAITVPIAPLAGEDPHDDGRATLRRVVDEYAHWIEQRKVEAQALSEPHSTTAARHLHECGYALNRMRAGLRLLTSDAHVAKAFQLMNAAMLEQQLRSARPTRPTRNEGGRFVVEGAPNPAPDGRGERAWRAFQIGFMLATLPSIVDPRDPDRDSVELIFFPTGGGKTEAYLGLAAVSILLRRLKHPADNGVQVLMRYTLRLLTTQQFSRAAALICALDQQRKAHPELGGPFRIGVWLGGGTTPNFHVDAKSALRKMQKPDKKAENPFLLLRCPWCAAQLGPLDNPPAKGVRVAGYTESGGEVIFQCPERLCPYNNREGLPVSVVDEAIYQSPPDFLLGTVDKFAALTWRPEARRIFGIGPDGNRVASPPELIIQDELHLISGPLGSMVGLYETAIEALCTDKRQGRSIKPKIVTSTATVRRYEDQAKALYARDDVRLFPPHGLNAADSFFAQYAREANGTLSPGRMYVGIHAPGLGSTQTAQVRTFAALLQAAENLPEQQRDPWWTLLSFFNSLRELGTSLTLLQSDIPDYLNVLHTRYGTDWSEVRRLPRTKELTSRLRHDEIPQAIEDLQRPYKSGSALDVCIASNIIEVGIDIDRLSVMAVVGQPKSTSQYIQVTGRVGRRWKDRPGLVATIYGASKPRDRSHFEHFRSYHSRLYAQVEPTSATPFSPPVLDRALHGVLVALVRQLGSEKLAPWPFDEELTARAGDLLIKRVAAVDPAESDELKRVLRRRLHEWRQWQRTEWQASGAGENVPLLRRAGQWVPDEARKLSWATPNSMRDVDADCRVEVSSAYRRAAGAEEVDL